MDEKTLGHKLQLARKRAGFTQQELCQKAGLSYSTLAKIERGAIRSPSVFTVASIAEATGIGLEELLGIKGKKVDSPALSGKKRSKTGIRFVYFDVNGTLVRYYQRGFTQIANETHVPLEVVESLFHHYDGAACRGTMSNDEVNKIFGSEIGVDDFSWKKFYMHNVEPTPGSSEFLEWVHQHYDIGLLTNNWLGYTDELIKMGAVPSAKYTAIIESAKVGCAKPEVKIYEMAQELAGVQPEEILLVDDEEAYLAGAKMAGWHTVLFDVDHPEESIARAKAALEF